MINSITHTDVQGMFHYSVDQDLNVSVTFEIIRRDSLTTSFAMLLRIYLLCLSSNTRIMQIYTSALRML